MDTTVRTPNSFLASNDPTPRAGSYPAWMIKAMEEYAQQKVDLSRKRIEALETALNKINAIRNSIIGMQGFNFSEHAYPLVAALNEAGIKGMEYPEARVNFGTMLERTNKAEKRIEELEAVLSECGKKLKWFNDLKRNGIKSMKADDLINSIDKLLNHEHTR